MWLTLTEKQALIAAHPWRFSAHILKSEHARGRKLSRCQVAYVEAVLGPQPGLDQPVKQPQRGVPA